MNDRELWQACVESGFTESQWWPLWNPHHWGPLSFTTDCAAGWYWNLPTRENEHCQPENARARILAGLVEWGTAEGRFIATIMDDCAVVYESRVMSLADLQQRVQSPDPHGDEIKHFTAQAENQTAALLACFKSWREAQ